MMWRRHVFAIALITALTLLVAFAIAVYVHHFGSAALHSSGYLAYVPRGTSEANLERQAVFGP